MPETQKISDRVKLVMSKWGLNQTELAAEMMVDSSYISRILKDERTNVSARVLERLQVLERRGPIRLVTESMPESSVVREDGPHILSSTAREAHAPSGARALLKAARTRAGLSISELAKMVGYRIGVLQAVEDGGARMSEPMAQQICKILPELTVERLLHGSDHPPICRTDDGPPMSGSVGRKPDIVLPLGIEARYVPLISMAQAGTLKSFSDEIYQHEGHMAFNVKDPRAIAVQIRGDSMAPNYSEGDIAILYPSYEARNSDLVIAKLNAELGSDVMFKIFNTTQSGQRVVLTSYNPAYPPLEYNRVDFAWIYPVASAVKTLRR